MFISCESHNLIPVLLTHVLLSAQINAASLGAQPQFLSSLTSTPIITSAMSNMAGITSQIITNAQGQVGAMKYCHSVYIMLCCVIFVFGFDLVMSV